MDLYEDKISCSKRSFLYHPCFATIGSLACICPRWKLVVGISFFFFPLSFLVCYARDFLPLGKRRAHTGIHYCHYFLFTARCWYDTAFCLTKLRIYRRR